MFGRKCDYQRFMDRDMIVEIGTGLDGLLQGQPHGG
jgi:hypothetical protein